MEAGIRRITRTSHAVTVAAALEMTRDWEREWGPGASRFVAYAVTADCCGKRFYEALPEDYQGAALACGHCGTRVCTG